AQTRCTRSTTAPRPRRNHSPRCSVTLPRRDSTSPSSRSATSSSELIHAATTQWRRRASSCGSRSRSCATTTYASAASPTTGCGDCCLRCCMSATSHPTSASCFSRR
ncbi:hypothetical protein PENTCL1PPCAC_9587, partial [Pristionchus entomophagus]